MKKCQSGFSYPNKNSKIYNKLEIRGEKKGEKISQKIIKHCDKNLYSPLNSDYY